MFAFKLHQFIGKGDTAYVTLNRPGERYLTTQYQRSSPDGPAGQPLFPLAFCRECGQDYLVVNRGAGGERFTPRILSGSARSTAEATGLLLSATPTGRPSCRARSSTWSQKTGSSTTPASRTLDKARRTRLPQACASRLIRHCR